MLSSFGFPGRDGPSDAGTSLTEARRQPAAADIIRIAAWNTLNRPNNAEQQSHFSTVLGAIGNEVVNGVSKRIDVLAVSETDTNSALDLASILNGLYSTSTYQAITSSSVGGDRTGFVFDTSSVGLQSSRELTAGLTHPIFVATFQPAGISEELTMYSVHLKSGTTNSNRSSLKNISP